MVDWKIKTNIGKKKIKIKHRFSDLPFPGAQNHGGGESAIAFEGQQRPQYYRGIPGGDAGKINSLTPDSEIGPSSPLSSMTLTFVGKWKSF